MEVLGCVSGLPAVAKHPSNVPALSLPRLRWPHLPSVQPFDQLKANFSRCTGTEEVGRVVTVGNWRPQVPRVPESRKALLKVGEHGLFAFDVGLEHVS